MMKGFLKNTAIMTAGAFGSQLLLVLITPLVTRLYSPRDFGLLSIYLSILSFCCAIASLRYEMAIVLPDNNDEANELVLLSLLLVIVNALIVYFIILVFGENIALLFNKAKLDNLFFMLPLGIFFVGSYQIFNKYAVRNKLFKAISLTRILQTITILIIQLVFFKLGAIALVAAQSFGQGAGSLNLSKNFFKKIKTTNKKNIFLVAKKYKRFPMYSTWASLLNTSGTQLPPIAFASLFSIQVAGAYSLAFTVLTAPIMLIGNAIGSVFLSDAASSLRNGELADKVNLIHNSLSKLSMPFAVTLILVVPDLFKYVFGSQWSLSGIFAQWMIPWVYLVFVTSPLSTTFEVMNKQSEYLIFQFLLFTVRLSAIFYGAYLKELTYAISLFALGSALCWLIFLLRLYRLIGLSITNYINSSFKSLLIGVLCSTPCLLGILLETDKILLFILTFISIIFCIVNARYSFKLIKKGSNYEL